MTELTLIVFRFGFLLLLWLFVFAIMYALRSDLFGSPVRKLRGAAARAERRAEAAEPITYPTAPAPAAPSGPVLTPSAGAMPTAGSLGPARKLVIVSGAAAGTELELDDQIVTIGRSPDSTLVIMDEYTSTYHARLNRESNGWVLTDLDSTNGTRLAGARVRDSVPLPTHTPVTIGKTTFELRP